MDTNSLIAAASGLQQAVLANKIDFAVAAKSMQAQRQQGQAAVDLIAAAAQVQDQLDNGYLDVQI